MKKWRVLTLASALCLFIGPFEGCNQSQSNQQSEVTSNIVGTSEPEIDEGDFQDPFAE